MTTFMQPPFWAPHAMGLSWPPVPIIRAGLYSRLITPPTVEPLTLDEGKLWSGFDWPAGDPREPLMTQVIAASRAYVEDDTGLALLTQTRDTFVYGAEATVRSRTMSAQVAGGALVWLPPKCRPIQSVVSMTWIDYTGTIQTIDPTWYSLDPGSGAIRLVADQYWPPTMVTIQVVAGWATVADLAATEPRLVHLVGRLVAHNMTLGRDLAIAERGAMLAIPFGYEDEVQPYRPEIVA